MDIISTLKWVFVAITVLGIAYFLINYLRYRLPSGPAETIAGDVFYKFASDDSNAREAFEQSFLGKSSIRFTDRSQWFVSKKDRATAWPESPHEMLQKGYTMHVTLQAKPLRFGGYGPATIVSATKVDKPPMVGK